DAPGHPRPHHRHDRHRGHDHRPRRGPVVDGARPARGAADELARAPPARVHTRERPHQGRVDGGDPVAHRDGADQRREAGGVHPRLRRARSVDARRAAEPPARPGGHAGDRARPLPHRGLAGARVRRRHVRRRPRSPAVRARRRPRAGRNAGARRGPRRVAGRRGGRVRVAAPGGRRGPPAREVHGARRRYVLRAHHRPARLRDPDGRAGREPHRAHRHQPLPPGARALPARRAGLRAADHPPVPGGRALPRQRRRVRGEARAGGDLHRARAGPDAGRRAERGRVVRGRLRLRPPAGL
ncbi:MAG: Catechol 1,2-dioxygenase 1, partial [uncultured Actinomycetospora sp.]